MGSCEVSSDPTDFRNDWDDNGPNTVNDANANIPNCTDMTTEPFTQGSGPSLPANFDVSVATTLDYFNLLFKPEIFSDIKDHTNSYAIFKQEKIGETEIILTMLSVCVAGNHS